MVQTTGFAGASTSETPQSENADDRLAEFDLRATPIDELEYDTLRIEDFAEGELPPLPWGFHTPGTGGNEEAHYVDYEVNPEVDSGKYDLFIAGLDPQNGQNISRLVPTITKFLAGATGYGGAIAKIGDKTSKEIASEFSTSGEKLFGQAYMADIATMMIGIRMCTENGRDIAIDQECPQGMNCAMGPKTQCRDMASLDDLEIKYPRYKNEPIFRVELEDGFNDGAGEIKYVYISPLKFMQIKDFFGGQKIADFEAMRLAIVAIPESKIYGRKKGLPFCKEIYESMSTSDINLIQEAIADIDAGPKLTLDIECACGQIDIPYQLPLFRNPRIFLYRTKRLGKER